MKWLRTQELVLNNGGCWLRTGSPEGEFREKLRLDQCCNSDVLAWTSTCERLSAPNWIHCMFLFNYLYIWIWLAVLAQMVACLLLVQQVRGSIPGGVVNCNLKIFNLGARRGGDIHFLIARCTSQSWIKFQTPPQYVC